jgi:hypothetical protein
MATLPYSTWGYTRLSFVASLADIQPRGVLVNCWPNWNLSDNEAAESLRS